MTVNLLSSPSPNEQVLAGSYFSRTWWLFVSRVTRILRGGEPLRMASYTVATLPSAADWPACLVYVSNEAGGAIPAFSDGAHWLRVTDRSEVTI